MWLELWALALINSGFLFPVRVCTTFSIALVQQTSTNIKRGKTDLLICLKTRHKINNQKWKKWKKNSEKSLTDRNIFKTYNHKSLVDLYRGELAQRTNLPLNEEKRNKCRIGASSRSIIVLIIVQLIQLVVIDFYWMFRFSFFLVFHHFAEDLCGVALTQRALFGLFSSYVTGGSAYKQ